MHLDLYWTMYAPVFRNRVFCNPDVWALVSGDFQRLSIPYGSDDSVIAT